MNLATKNQLQKLLIEAIDEALDTAIEGEGLALPALGDSTLDLMAVAALAVLEAVEDARQLNGQAGEGLEL